MNYKKVFYIFISASFLFGAYLPSVTHADTLGQNVSFFTDPKYDYYNRHQVNATLYATSAYAYYYVENDYFARLGINEKSNFTNNLNQIAQEFDTNIYPKETALWGPVAALGTSNGQKVTILLAHLTTGTGGYFDANNGYPTSLIPTSNYRPMITINASSLVNNTPRIVESFITHEFQHLISFTRKDLLNSISEDTWLNELRSEYSIAFVGYNDPFQGSSLQRRVNNFLENPSDSLTEWLNQPFEYGAVSLFGKYLVEQYSIGILKETMMSPKTGIASINEYLRNHAYTESFEDIFKNWVAANYLNDPSVGYHYAYQDLNLNNIRIRPTENNLFYPATYTYNYWLKPWQPAWYKFNLEQNIPKNKIIKIEFSPTSAFGLIYMDKSSVKKAVDNQLYIANTSSISSFVLSPYNKSKTSDFTDNDQPANFIMTISFVDTQPINLTTKAVSLSLNDGALIEQSGEKNSYVITGAYKRHMTSSAISKYGHLAKLRPLAIDSQTFKFYKVSNYIRLPESQLVYSVWPDGTKHLLKTSFKNLVKIGIDPSSVFTVSLAEFRIYKTGRVVLK